MAQTTQIVQIPITKFKISKFNVRKDLGDISELVLSVKSELASKHPNSHNVRDKIR